MHRRPVPVVVVGSGVAGLSCALALAPTPVVVVTKTAQPAGGSSLLSQGGIAAALDPADSPRQHAIDTLRAGDGIADEERVALTVGAGPEEMRRLIAAGFPADRGADGELLLGREGAHRRRRIVHAGGDATGRNLVTTLLDQVAQTPSIELLTATIAIDLLVDGGRVAGLLAYREGDGWIRLETSAVVLATGGAGALWAEMTNPAEASGDGLALAARAGAMLADLEFVQFHPTALLPRRAARRTRLPLLTEALRGAGARLLDKDGKAFMSREHRLGDLAPRDAVARAIWRRRSAGEPVYLDLRPALDLLGEAAFPQAVALCRDNGYEPTSAPVPITPAAHYHMGGVLTDEFGRSSLAGLWACGEVASTGVHGANRLASNSLLESLVWARRVAESVRETPAPAPGASAKPATALPAIGQQPRGALERMKDRLRAVMSSRVGIVRHGPGLSEASFELEQLTNELSALARAGWLKGRFNVESLRAWADLRNMLLAGRLVTVAALRRTESRGAHFRSDFPCTRSEWARQQLISLADLEAPQRGSSVLARTA